MAKGLDGPHDFRNSIEIHLHDQPKSSSDGPAPAGGTSYSTPPSNAVPDMASFSNAHSQARSGDPYRPTTPGGLGSSSMFPTPDPISYDPGMPSDPSHPVNGAPGAYAWPDAPGGGLA